MTRLLCIASLTFTLLSGCGGSGGDPASNGGGLGGGNPPTGQIPPVQFKALTGLAPADAALGQPFWVEWTLPAAVSIASIQLEATAQSGPAASRSSCAVSAGSLPITAITAPITIPNTCAGRTVNHVRLDLTVESIGGQRTTATHSFAAPAMPAAYRPARMTLPVFRITTDNGAPVINRDDYVTGQMSLESQVAGEVAVIGGLQIRGRGNSTWDMPKKPYRLKLTDKQSLLGMPASRDWVLLANYSDKTLLRNSLALGLGQAIGMPWTPRSAFVELFLNDAYAGVYLLSENIKIAKDRVDIDELAAEDVDPDQITGGYLLEVDFRQDGHTMFSGLENLPIVFQDPEEPTQAQEGYIQDYVDQFESVLASADFADPVTGYAAFIDVDSFVRWYLVNEIFRNRDAVMWSSCWMYKPRGARLHMGPLWDFDIAAGNINYDNAFQTSGWWVRDAPWFSRLFEDPAFVARVRQVWGEMKATQIPALFQSLATGAATLQQAQLNNFQRWPILESYVWPNNRVPGSYAGEVDYLGTWLAARIAWMELQFRP
jgi:hypothetical protein